MLRLCVGLDFPRVQSERFLFGLYRGTPSKVSDVLLSGRFSIHGVDQSDEEALRASVDRINARLQLWPVRVLVSFLARLLLR